jgi:hypothetical protein
LIVIQELAGEAVALQAHPVVTPIVSLPVEGPKFLLAGEIAIPVQPPPPEPGSSVAINFPPA